MPTQTATASFDLDAYMGISWAWGGFNNLISAAVRCDPPIWNTYISSLYWDQNVNLVYFNGSDQKVTITVTVFMEVTAGAKFDVSTAKTVQKKIELAVAAK